MYHLSLCSSNKCRVCDPNQNITHEVFDKDDLEKAIEITHYDGDPCIDCQGSRFKIEYGQWCSNKIKRGGKPWLTHPKLHLEQSSLNQSKMTFWEKVTYKGSTMEYHLSLCSSNRCRVCDPNQKISHDVFDKEDLDKAIEITHYDGDPCIDCQGSRFKIEFGRWCSGCIPWYAN
jgi:hypothetical protein